MEIVYRSFELDPNAPKVNTEDLHTLIDRKHAVSRAQPADMFLEVLEKAWHEGEPAYSLFHSVGILVDELDRV